MARTEIAKHMERYQDSRRAIRYRPQRLHRFSMISCKKRGECQVLKIVPLAWDNLASVFLSPLVVAISSSCERPRSFLRRPSITWQ
jgi:hypothetical protein